MNDSPPSLIPEEEGGSPQTVVDEGGSSLPAMRPPDVEPLTPSLIGKLFGVPLLIVGVIVGGAVTVVLLFGAPAEVEERSIATLLQTLEASTGVKTMGMLLTREKELWEAALELSQRLERKESELGEVELATVAERIGDMVRAELAILRSVETPGPENERQLAQRSKRLQFLLCALARTGLPHAAAELTDVVRTGREPYVRVAMQQLGELHELAEARQAADPIVEVLRTSHSTETRLIACTLLSLIAEKGDRRVIDALSSARLSGNGEVEWAASLALARLGSSAGKSTLLDLLDRSFWETGERYEAVDAAGRVRRHPMPPGRIDELLIAAIDAVGHLDDPELRGMLQQLTSDRSPRVRARAVEVLKRST